MSDAAPHIVVTGPMGVGKSTLGMALAEESGRRYVDSDDDISTLFGMPGVDLAAAHGIPTLHQIESGTLLGALAAPEPSVITAAASVVENPMVREALARRATVIWLTATVEEILSRQPAGDHRRPMDEAELRALSDRRDPFFREVADHHISSSQPAPAVVAEALALLQLS